MLLLALAVAPARAQTTPALEQLTFDQAIQRAVDKNPTVAGAATAILRAEGLLQQARAATRPSVSATVTNTTLDSARGFSGGVTQPRNQTVFGADLTIPLLATSRWAAAAQAADQIDIAKLSTADVRRQIAVSTAQAYLAVIAQKRQVQVNLTSGVAARAHFEYAQRRRASGAGTQLNELRAAQEVSTDESRLENARLGLRQAQEALGVLVGGSGPVDAGDEPAFEVPSSINAEGLLALRSDVKLFTAQQHAAERVLRDSTKDILPTVTASFDPQFVTPSGLFQPSKTWRFTIAFTQPIFEGGLRAGTKKVRQSAVDAAALALAGIELQARADVRLAEESVRSYERALGSARTAASQAAEVLRITTVAFEAGATTNLEVIDAQRSARDAETSVAIAEDAVRRARLDLLVALGRFPK